MSLDNKIFFKRNNTSGFVPSVTSLSSGEIGMNISDGKLFIKKIENSNESIAQFLNSEDYPYVLNKSLSSIVAQFGNNNASQVLSLVLGGFENNVSGAGSTIVNGESNEVTSDFAFIGTGFNNKIHPTGDYSAIIGGQNNHITHKNSFTIGSNLSSHAENFTYVNNISGILWGDGSNISNVIGTDLNVRNLSGNWQNTYNTVQANSAQWAIDSTLDSDVRALTSFWDSTYTTVNLNSATTWNYQGTDVKALSSNWQSTYTTVSSNSSTWANKDIIDLSFKTAYSTYYHELKYNSITSDLTAIQIYQNNSKSIYLFEKLLTYTSSSLLTGISITDKVSNRTLTKILSYDSMDNLITTTRIYN